jgi:hypothetical protein
VKNVFVDLSVEAHRALVMDGIVAGVESLEFFDSRSQPEIERAVMGYFRHFPALKEMKFHPWNDMDPPPLLVPPTLEVLTLNADMDEDAPSPFFGRLGTVIKNSGARLRKVEIENSGALKQPGTRSSLRTFLFECSSRLKTLHLDNGYDLQSAPEVVEGLAGCEGLEAVEARCNLFAVMPPGPCVLRSLVDLSILGDWCMDEDRRGLSSLGLWGLMARNGLPVLACLRFDCRGGWKWGMEEGGAELGSQLVAAFEGVAGTLKSLTLRTPKDASAVQLRGLGRALGKLHHLEDLDLDVAESGQGYHWLAEGMAIGACPRLVSLTYRLDRDAEWVSARPSIVLPSVRRLTVDVGPKEGLALACGLLALGYSGGVCMPQLATPTVERGFVLKLLRPRLSSVSFSRHAHA